uniref:Uncharacterized protein n=1 Tax=viral metagenome TaxID=1070528 RepID=A0A6M3IXV8_9ZZZZ
MAKSSEDTSKTVQRGAYICSACKSEFEGTHCPECGNGKGNIRLAQDGIEHELHKTSHLFSASNLRATEDLMMSDSQQLERKRIQMQMEELDDNLREAQVIRTKIKMRDQEMALKRKEIEAKKLDEQSEDYISGRSNTPPSQSQQREEQSPFPQMPFMSTMSPQAVFMQQLMRMDSKKRAEFIDQLSEADPGALANLSSMFQQAQPQQQQQQMYPSMQPNQYGQYPMMPPWMQQPQQQTQQQPQTSPIELVKSIFELSREMQPQRDDSVKDLLHEFKDDLKKVHDRMDTVLTREREKDTSPLLEKMNSLEQKFNNGERGKSIVDQVNDLTSLVDGLEKAGLVRRSGSSDKTIDDELKLKEFDFKRETKNREIEIEESRMEAEKSKSNLTQSIVSSLLQRGIQKGIQAREDEDTPRASQGSASRTPPTLNRVRTVRPPEPVEVISEVATEAGVVRETRRPVKKTETGGE